MGELSLTQRCGVLEKNEQPALTAQSGAQWIIVMTWPSGDMNSYRQLAVRVKAMAQEVTATAAAWAEQMNQTLSQQRAAAVVAWLAQNGIDKARLVAQGFGDSKPVADNTTEEGRAKNRRVELVKL